MKPNIKALMIQGGWQGHEPAQTVEIMAAALRGDGMSVDVVDSLDPLADAERLGQYALISICWTMGEIAKEPLQGLLQAVKGGTGFAGWHGGAGDAFRAKTEYQFMVGGQWVAHPGGIIDYTVQITDRADPVMAGLDDFAMHSEQYYMHVDPGNHVLAATEFAGQHAPWIAGTVMPVAWKRHYGDGRVFYCSLGHVAADFTPPVVTIMRRGMHWAARHGNS